MTRSVPCAMRQTGLAAERCPVRARSAIRRRARWEPPTNAVLLRAALDLGQVAEPAGRADVEEEVEQRHLVRLARQHALGEQLDGGAAHVGEDVAPAPEASVCESRRSAPGASTAPSTGTPSGRAAAWPSPGRRRAGRAGSCGGSAGVGGQLALRHEDVPAHVYVGWVVDAQTASEPRAPGPGWGRPTEHRSRPPCRSPIGSLSVRPPTRSRASSTITSRSAPARARAAASPASPAPTTTTSTSRRSIVRRAYPSSTSLPRRRTTCGGFAA